MYTPVRPSTRCRPAGQLATTVVPARRWPLPPDDEVDGLFEEEPEGRKAGRGRERRLAVAGPELEATLEEDWPGRNLVWWACGRRDGAQPSSTVAVNNSCQAPDEIKRMACFARGRLLQTQGLLFKTATSRL